MRIILRHMVWVAAASLLSACAMVNSDLLPTAHSSKVTHCDSSLGAYYISKSLIGVHLKTIKDSAAEHEFDPLNYELQVSGPYAEPDRSRGYCLDFLGSPTSHDIIKVDRDENSGLLHKVTSLADDQSVEIAKRLIDIFFFGATTLSAGGGGRSSTKPTIEQIKARYDPTDIEETVLINERLNDYGLCLVLEGQPPFSAFERPAYCENPRAFVSNMGASWQTQYRYKSTDQRLSSAGALFYRPRQPYSYYVLQKQNRYDPSSWKLRESKTIELENLSPVIAIGVNRSFFTRRRTALVFDQGVLRDVKVDKNSELAGFVEIPLYLANTIVAIPGTVAQLRINNTESNARLTAMRLRVIEKQIALQETRAKANQKMIDSIAADQSNAGQGL